MIIYTVINHPARRALGISEAEYCLLDLVYKYSTNPNSRVPGWCYASKPEIAREREISERGLYKMLDRLRQAGLIISQPETGHLRTTQKWFEAVIAAPKVAETTPELSSPQPLHFVQPPPEQSAVPPLNKVQFTPELSSPNKSNYKSKEINTLSHTRTSEAAETIEADFSKKIPSPARPETLSDACAAAAAWCDANPEQVRFWRETARYRDDLGPPIASFFSHWWGENGKQHKCRTDPMDFFTNRFLKWLQGEARIQQQTQQTHNGNSSTTTSSTGPARARINRFESDPDRYRDAQSF